MPLEAGSPRAPSRAHARLKTAPGTGRVRDECGAAGRCPETATQVGYLVRVSRLSKFWNARHRLLRGLSPPERQVFVREGDRIRYVPLSPRRQLAFAAAGFFGFACLLVVLFAYLMQSSRVDELSVALAESQASNRFLLNSMGARPSKADSLSQDLENDVAAVTKLAEQTRAFQDDVAAAQSRLRDASADDRAKLTAMQDAANRQLQALDTALRTLEGHGSRLKSSLAGIETGPQTPPAAPPSKSQPQTLVRVGDLEQRMAALQATQTELLARVADSASVNIGRAERAIRVSGIDLDKLLGDMTSRKTARGGPFVPLAPEAYTAAGPSGDAPDGGDAGKIDRLETLQQILKVMPLATPIKKYEVVSGFGPRTDPFTGRPAMHYGLDFIGSSGSAIRATAAGQVSYTGWKAAYGKTVEIDHGMGFRTRYAHLSKIAVRRGQEIKTGDIVGEMGSTGRSTGAHLHYEVLFNDEPRDPMRFIRAGSHVLDKS